MIVPFPTTSGKGQDVVVRFAFEQDIAPEAQRMLAGMLARFAQSVRGVEATSFVLDAHAGEWVASMKFRDRVGPQIEVGMPFGAKTAQGGEL